MHEEVVTGMSHLIEDEKAYKDESHTLYGQSIEQERKSHQVHDDIYLAAVVFCPEKLRVLEKFCRYLGNGLAEADTKMLS
jgi:hypothetical protein